MCDKEELGILSCMYDGDKNRDKLQIKSEDLSFKIMLQL